MVRRHDRRSDKSCSLRPRWTPRRSPWGALRTLRHTPEGGFLFVLRGYPEDVQPVVKLQRAGKTRGYAFADGGSVVADPLGGRAWKLQSFAFGTRQKPGARPPARRPGCVSFFSARSVPGEANVSSPPVCGLDAARPGVPQDTLFFQTRRLSGNQSPTGFMAGDWNGHAPSREEGRLPDGRFSASYVHYRVHRPRVTVIAPDPAGGPEWAVKAFDAERISLTRRARTLAGGRIVGRNRCVQLGRIKDGAFGWVYGDGRFRRTRTAAEYRLIQCTSRKRPQLTAKLESVLTIADPAAPAISGSVVWGITPDAGPVTVAGTDGADGVATPAGDAFLRLGSADAKPGDDAVVQAGGHTLRLGPSRGAPNLGRVKLKFPTRRLPGRRAGDHGAPARRQDLDRAPPAGLPTPTGSPDRRPCRRIAPGDPRRRDRRGGAG
jgi:hypothetical protein